MSRKNKSLATVPLNFLLGCSDDALSNYYLARLSEIANLRSELHAVLDRLIDQTSQADLAAWFKVQDRQTLKDAIKSDEDPRAWAKRQIREGQRSGEELLPVSPLLPGAIHLRKRGLERRRLSKNRKLAK